MSGAQLDTAGAVPGLCTRTDALIHVDTEVDLFLAEVRAELLRARAKFPGDRIMTVALAEEFGELCKAVLDESAANVRKEAVQTAVMAARVVLDGDGSVRDWRAAKGLDPIGVASPPAEPAWCYSLDEECFHGHFETRDEAVAELRQTREGAGESECGGYVARVRAPQEFFDAERLGTTIEENVGEVLSDEVGELAEGFALKREQRAALGRLVLDWIAAGPGFGCWGVRSVEQVDVAGAAATGAA